MVRSTLSSREAVEVSNESFTQTSTPVPSASVDQQALPRSSHSNPMVQHTPLSFREAVENPLVRAGLVPQLLADIFFTARADEVNDKCSS